MKPSYLNQINIATPSIADSLAVTPSEARQSRMVGDSLDCRVAFGSSQ